MKNKWLLICAALTISSLEAGRGKRRSRALRTAGAGAGAAASTATAAAEASAATEAADSWKTALQQFKTTKNTEGPGRVNAMTQLVLAARPFQQTGSIGKKRQLQEARAQLTADEQNQLRDKLNGLDLGLSEDEGDAIDRHAKVKNAHLRRAKNKTARGEIEAARGKTQIALSDVEKQITAFRALQRELLANKTSQEATIQQIDAAQIHLETYQNAQIQQLDAQAEQIDANIEEQAKRLARLQEQLQTEQDTGIRDTLTSDAENLATTLVALREKKDSLANQKSRMEKRIVAGDKLLQSDSSFFGLFGQQ